MKKIFSILIIFVFVTVLSYNLKITTESKNVADIQLESLEAMACYTVYIQEAGPLCPRQCCEPYFYFCYSDPLVGALDGWPVY